MKRTHVVRAAVAVTAALALMSLPPQSRSVLAASMHHRVRDLNPINLANCLEIAVLLNGNQPPLVSCTVSRVGTTSSSNASLHRGLFSIPAGATHAPKLVPQIGSFACDNSLQTPQIQLFNNVGFDTSAGELCLFGSGSVNLGTYGWNDIMSSWRVTSVHNSPSGRVYWDINDGNPNFTYAPGQQNPNVGSGWNDQASSVCIAGTGGCPN